MNRYERAQILDINDKLLSVRSQCSLLDICRSSIYYKPLFNTDSQLANLIKEIYLDSDCRYGYRKITKELHHQLYDFNHKKVLKTMREIGIQGLCPRRSINTTVTNKEHYIYPYLLDGLKISEPNQVWATDLTYISIQGKFMYFMAIIDIYSRYIIAYDLSSSLEASFCVDLLDKSLNKFKPSIFNTDQGAQFTSNDFISLLKKNKIQISMDHKGRCFDNIYVERLWRTLKQEAIYYYRPENIKELWSCLQKFVLWYNTRRLHQSLDYYTPESVYFK